MSEAAPVSCARANAHYRECGRNNGKRSGRGRGKCNIRPPVDGIRRTNETRLFGAKILFGFSAVTPSPRSPADEVSAKAALRNETSHAAKRHLSY